MGNPQSRTIREIADEHLSVARETLNAEYLSILEDLAGRMAGVLRGGGKILICGNGGSAADAQHIAAEFVCRFKRERSSYPALALTTDTSCLTAIANDYDYSKVFSRQVEGHGSKGDLLVGISTSGNSQNVLEALNKAREMGLITVALTGKCGGRIAAAADLAFRVPSADTPHIQEMHITALHAVSEVVESLLCDC